MSEVNHYLRKNLIIKEKFTIQGNLFKKVNIVKNTIARKLLTAKMQEHRKSRIQLSLVDQHLLKQLIKKVIYLNISLLHKK